MAADVTTPRRIAYLSFGSGRYDARMLRMARTARQAGYEVVAYSRWYPGLPVTEVRDGVRVVRAHFDWRLAIPGLRGRAARRAAAEMGRAPTEAAETEGLPGGPADPARAGRPRHARPLQVLADVSRPARGWLGRWWRRLRLFPLYPMGWAAALEAVAEPADLWHAMWAGSLPAVSRLARRFGGATVYDSRDVFMESREMAAAGQPGRWLIGRLERRWARGANRVITVNDAYAGLLRHQLRIEAPLVVMNLPEPWTPEVGALDGAASGRRVNLIRDTLGLPDGTRLVLYSGGLMSDRGIEQAMQAILSVPNAALCLLGFGRLRDTLIDRCAEPPYAGRVFVLDPVPPAEVVRWTAAADVAVMAIQPTSVNHAYTTPQKLFEAIAAGVPVVASDLPGMAPIVRDVGAGSLCDPTDPASIAAALRSVLDASPEEAVARRERILRAARERYNWDAEAPKLLGLYDELLAASTMAR